MATGIDELFNMLYDMIDDAKNAPLSSDKCVLERDKALDLLDEIRAQFPVELAEAKKLLASRNEYITSARREADIIRKQAEEQAKQMVADNELMAQARQRSNDMVRQAEDRSRELKTAAHAYCKDVLIRTEKAIAEAYDEIKKSRTHFQAAAGVPAAGAQPGNQRPPMFDAAAVED